VERKIHRAGTIQVLFFDIDGQHGYLFDLRVKVMCKYE
jgi:hypothetical protein